MAMAGYRFLPGAAPGPFGGADARMGGVRTVVPPLSESNLAPLFWDPIKRSLVPFPPICVHRHNHVLSAFFRNLKDMAEKKSKVNQKVLTKMHPENAEEFQLFIQAPWGKISVLVWGNCTDPPVLMVHGNEDNAATFIPLLRFLPKKFYYIALELPGMGRSDRMHPGMMITMYDLISVIDKVAKHFRWNTFAYIGHALGAILGKLYNHAVPNKISKLVEIEPINFVGIEPESFAQWYHNYFTVFYRNYQELNMAKDRGPKYIPQHAVAAVMRSRGISNEIASRIVARSTRPTTDGYVRNIVDQRLSLIPAPAFTPDYIRGVFLKLKTPTLHIVSSESVNLNKFKNTAFLQHPGNYPNKNMKCVQLEGKHDIHLQKPEEVALFVSQFLLGGPHAKEIKAKL